MSKQIKLVKSNDKRYSYALMSPDEKWHYGAVIGEEAGNEICQRFNEYDNLASEVESLKKELKQLSDMSIMLVQRIEKHVMDKAVLREALKKCSPDTTISNDEDDEIYVMCDFCKKAGPHAGDCEYMRLIGGDGE